VVQPGRIRALRIRRFDIPQGKVSNLHSIHLSSFLSSKYPSLAYAAYLDIRHPLQRTNPLQLKNWGRGPKCLLRGGTRNFSNINTKTPFKEYLSRIADAVHARHRSFRVQFKIPYSECAIVAFYKLNIMKCSKLMICSLAVVWRPVLVLGYHFCLTLHQVLRVMGLFLSTRLGKS